MKLAIVGSRYFENYELFTSVVQDWIEKNGTPEVIISGACRGADRLAARFAKENNIPLKEFPFISSMGRAGGPARNTLIVQEATHMIAFPQSDSGGTADSIRKAEKKGIPLLVFQV